MCTFAVAVASLAVTATVTVTVTVLFNALMVDYDHIEPNRETLDKRVLG
jgi:hypothetical protein